MFINFIKFAARAALKQKAYTAVNITGLAIGLATSIFILLFVFDELSYDTFHANAANIYRINEQLTLSDEPDLFPIVPMPVGPTLMKDYPEIQNSVRIISYQVANRVPVVRKDEKRFYEEKFAFTETSFFEIFSFNLLYGNPSTALEGPNKIILTKEMALKYFEKESVVGEFLKLDGEIDLEITGVIENFPDNSHIQFDFLASLGTLINNSIFPIPDIEQNWDPNWFWTYVLLSPNSSGEELESKLDAFVDKYFTENMKQNNPKLEVEPLEKIHLYSATTEGEITPKGNILYVYIFFTIAIGILIIAAVNYMNLATARFSKRALEVGIKKVLGAEKKDLMNQFLMEAVFLSLIAALLALLIVELLLPFYNQITGKEFHTIINFSNLFLPGTIILAVVVGLVSGFYPALFLSTLEPIKTLSGKLRAGAKSGIMRKLLVGSQFIISMLLIIGTVVVFKQLNFIREKDLGFSKDQIIVLKVDGTGILDNLDAFKNALKRNNNILSASAMTANFGEWVYSWFFEIEGQPENKLVPFIGTDFDFVEATGIKIKEGRGFDRSMLTDSTSFIVNEAFVEKYNMVDATNRYLRLDFGDNQKGRIVGVVENFNFESLQNTVTPLIIMINSFGQGRIAVRIKGNDVDNTISYIENTWVQFEEERPPNFYFLDEQIDKLYRTENTMAEIFTYFSVNAIFIACLGLFALSSFTIEQRRKEIGVRKVLGASIRRILILLSKDYLLLIFVSAVTAIPVGLILMNKWLEEFAFKTSITIIDAALSLLIVLVIAFSSIGLHVWKAAKTNPVESIKYE